MTVDEIIELALLEDIGDGDHSSLACVPEFAKGKATLFIKDDGILACVDLAVRIFKKLDPSLEINILLIDGTPVKKGDVAFTVIGSSRSILATERLVLNFMQRMSGIATQTHKIVSLLEGTNTRLLDTRKTTPCIRYMEKWAVRIGGGENHRFALYDMIMLKDNHIDYAGGIKPAIEGTLNYLKETGKKRKPHSEETKKKISQANKGRCVSEATRKKLSEIQKGKTLSEETKKKISKIHKGKIVSDETKKKMGKSKLNNKYSKKH